MLVCRSKIEQLETLMVERGGWRRFVLDEMDGLVAHLLHMTPEHLNWLEVSI